MKKQFFALISAPVLLLAGNAQAVDISFIPRADIGYTNYSFEWTEQVIPDVGVPGPKHTITDISVNLLTGSIGGTLTVGKFYLDAYLQQSTEGSDDYTIGGYTHATDWDVDVFDYALTAGYNVWSTLAIFGGWKGHETTLDGNVLLNNGITNVNWDNSFETDGFFLGASYGFVIGEAGVLSINAAYAWMNGDFEGHQTYSSGTTRDFKADDGDSGGFRIGIGWKGYITDALAYSVNADYYSYSYDDFKHKYSKNGAPYVQTNWNNEIDESAYSLRAGISYTF